MDRQSCTLYEGDCFQVMDRIAERSIDLVLCDLPYGCTQAAWDKSLDLSLLWKKYRRILRPGAPLLFSAIQPFASALVMSNLEWFRDEWIWRKAQGTNFLSARRRPMRNHESFLVFCESSPAYFPQCKIGKPYTHGKSNPWTSSEIYADGHRRETFRENSGTRLPVSVLDFAAESSERGLHSTQKPVSLLSYLIQTYSLPGAVILDNCMGSGSTGVAALQTGRRFIGIEKSAASFELAAQRLFSLSSVALVRHQETQGAPA